MHYRNSAMSTNNEFLLLFGRNNLHVFDENLKLVRSTKGTSISTSNLVDMIWCESIRRFIVLSKARAYVFDPITTQLSRIESIQLKNEEHHFVSCACSHDKLFIVTSESRHPCYMHLYKLPSFVFISRLTVTDLIGPDPKYSQYKYNPSVDYREIISVRYNHQRLGIMMKVDRKSFLYSLDLTEQPISITRMELSKSDGKLVVLTKSGEWLILYHEYIDKLMQISLDCQFKTDWKSKNYSKSSFFSLPVSRVLWPIQLCLAHLIWHYFYTNHSHCITYD
jgi:hypothetical protein